ncbi:MAG: ATP-binding protein [bacterium]
MRCLGIKDHLLWLGIGLSVFFVIIESVLCSFVFHKGSFISQLLTVNPLVIWSRLLVLGLILTFAVYARLTMARRRQIEEALRKSKRELIIRNRIAGIFLTIPTDAEIYTAVLEVILSVTESKRGYFGYINQDGALASFSLTKDPRNQSLTCNKELIFSKESWEGIWGQSLKEKKTLYSNTPLSVSEGHPALLRALAVPILYQDSIIGQILVADKGVDYTKDDQDLLEITAGHIAPILNTRSQRDRQEKERRWMEQTIQASHLFLKITNWHTETVPLLEEFRDEVRKFTGCEAAGIRILDNEGRIPYHVYAGFSREFYEEESPLSINSDQCMCIDVIKGATDPKFSFYTKNGSFFINGTTRFLATVSEKQKRQIRNRCNQAGYESVALVPIRLHEQNLGLIHVADRRENMIPLNMVEALEGAALQLGEAIQRIQAEQASKCAYMELKQIFNTAVDGMRVVNKDFTILRINEMFASLSGRGRDESLGKKCYEVFWGNLCHTPGCPLARILSGEERIECDVEKERSDGSRISCMVTATPFRGAQGELIGIVENFKDITERKRTEGELQRIRSELEVKVKERTAELLSANRALQEEIQERKRTEEALRQSEAQLRQSQKMEAIGMLAGGVAHDFNNLVQAIMGFSELLMDGCVSSEEVHEFAEEIKSASSRAAILTRQLLAFGRRQILQPEVLNVNKVIASTEKMLRRLIGEDIDLVTDLGSGLGSVKADPGQIEQVIMNLSVNARDAMPRGGRLTIRSDSVVLTENECRVIPEGRPGTFVCLSVTDTGCGMDRAVMDRIFEPFFTTKGPGNGTGLGLSTVYGIIKQHEGWIDVSSQPGQGSTFRMFLPVFSVKLPEKNHERALPLQGLQGNGERILLVEDEQGARQFAAQALRKNGYIVCEAASAREASDIFSASGDSFHLVFSDVVLPDKTGIELVDHLLALRPEQPILFCSGYTDQKSQWPLICKRKFRFLQKPYLLAELLSAVQETIRLSKAHSS